MMQTVSSVGLIAGLKKPRGSWTKLADWYEGDERLVAVSAAGYRGRAIDLLAYGLQRLEGRALHLVVPRAGVDATRARDRAL